MTAINSGSYVSFRRGGSLEITDDEAAATYTVSGIDEDSLEWTPGMYAALFDTENGQPSAERRGDAQRSTITARFKMVSGELAAAALYGLLADQTKATDDGTLRTFTILHKQTDHSGDATGNSASFANCVPIPGTLRYRSGADYNTIECQFSSRSSTPTLATF